MHTPGDRSAELHGQDTDLWIVGVLFPHVQGRAFVDVGAEKGGFAAALLGMGFERGVLCEPLPSHVEELRRRFTGSPATILPCAIDSVDRTAYLHVACDAAGNDLDYFHSLNRVPDHEYFRHGRRLEIQCRSLESLAASGELAADIGLLKIDTEGNDLRVLQGLGPLRPELIMCEFVPPAVYPHWPLSFAENLLPEAARLGYRHIVAIQRTHGVAGERVRIDPAGFTAHDWGNLVLVRDDVFAAAATDLRAQIRSRSDRFHGASMIPVRHDPRYGVAFAEWLRRQVEGFSRAADRAVAIDVGAHEGAFCAPLYEHQCDPAAVIAWLAERGYRLMGFFDEHFGREGWLAWTDACFVPVARLSAYHPPFVLRGWSD